MDEGIERLEKREKLMSARTDEINDIKYFLDKYVASGKHTDLNRAKMALEAHYVYVSEKEKIKC
jgi:hypothetical protein